jgi:hypothetical protein
LARIGRKPIPRPPVECRRSTRECWRSTDRTGVPVDRTLVSEHDLWRSTQVPWGSVGRNLCVVVDNRDRFSCWGLERWRRSMPPHLVVCSERSSEQSLGRQPFDYFRSISMEPMPTSVKVMHAVAAFFVLSYMWDSVTTPADPTPYGVEPDIMGPLGPYGD